MQSSASSESALNPSAKTQLAKVLSVETDENTAKPIKNLSAFQPIDPFTPHNIAGFDQHYTTSEAASVLRVKPQTMRKWACFEKGPIKPVRRNGRLLWSGADLQKCLQGRV